MCVYNRPDVYNQMLPRMRKNIVLYVGKIKMASWFGVFGETLYVFWNEQSKKHVHDSIECILFIVQVNLPSAKGFSGAISISY
jgi:hypothetical protein